MLSPITFSKISAYEGGGGYLALEEAAAEGTPQSPPHLVNTHQHSGRPSLLLGNRRGEFPASPPVGTLIGLSLVFHFGTLIAILVEDTFPPWSIHAIRNPWDVPTLPHLI